MLTLPIKKKWFDMIATGKKAEEYRTIKPYYTTRFINAGLLDADGKTTTGEKVKIALRNGYSKDDPTLIATVNLMLGKGKTEWGAVDGEFYYILNIVERHSIYIGNIEHYRYIKEGEQDG